ncbi:ShlB/FhaC/HecB family hemolysin secretion/activation protein [Massilia sp. MS-15]|uniref:ShlB/FhaC/HecB family hemolysin secretion/activation protein n=1 Tax=Massilia sp. MS-15 TaxID=2878200 RepID=UPI001CD59E58|nr:ShlB/FhaC/HecB family hemolysin secretion/activation protein [Massilia sp. MS-15]MCA1246430.1 BamA/TamA family outer membrane protein [Massilia sp. MS-15]
MTQRLRTLVSLLAHAFRPASSSPPPVPAHSPGLLRGATCAMLLLCPLGGAAAQEPQKMAVASVRVEGNTLLPEQTVNALTADLAGTPRSLDELNAAAARIQQAYRDAGYGGVVVFIPPQQGGDGRIVMRVVEGKLANVRVTGNQHFDTANVRAGLPHLREGTTPMVRAIDRDIQLANDNPAKHLKVTLAAGARSGEIDASVDVTDVDPLQYLVGYNNTGTPLTGRHRLSLGVQHANLFGRDHVGTLQFQTSPEDPDKVKIFSASYRVPLYAQAASVDAYVAHSSVNVATTVLALGPLDFNGRGTMAGVRLNRYLDRIGEYDHQVTLGADWRDYKDQCALLELPGADCSRSQVDVTTMPLSLAYVGHKQGSDLAYGLNVSATVNAGGSGRAAYEAARAGGKRHYVITRLIAFAEKRLGETFSINGRMELQYSPHRLIPAETYGVGGVNSVRGYREREVSGDLGLLARLELSASVPELADKLRIRPYLFVDYGNTRNHGGASCDLLGNSSCALSSVGLGSRFGWNRKLSASVDIGRALRRGSSTSSGDVRGHVAINLSF